MKAAHIRRHYIHSFSAKSFAIFASLRFDYSSHTEIQIRQPWALLKLAGQWNPDPLDP
jgi:hypothetical protein